MSSRLPFSRVRRISGFGRNSVADGYVYQPVTVEGIQTAIQAARQAGLKLVVRGAGRSYGDPAVAPEAVVLDLTGFNKILSWDAVSGVIRAEAGATLEQVWRHCIGDGYWLPVTSGTMFPTLGGALGMNIHGKNNFCAGTIGEHVLSLEMLLMSGETVRLTPEDELFKAVISGAGLLGIITHVEMKMHKVPSSHLRVVGKVCEDLEEQFATFESHEGISDYIVTWVDCFGGGRGLFHSATYLDEPTAKGGNLDLPSKILGIVPKSQVWRILKLFSNRPGMRLINALKYLSARFTDNGKPHRQSLVQFSYLLDYVPGWEKSYAHGFHQFQAFVPAEFAQLTFQTLLDMQREAKMESFLGVMKRHRPDDFLLSHAVDGYSLAMDFPIHPRTRPQLEDILREMAEVVLANQGRFYLAKDGVLTADQYARSLGPERLARFKKWRTTLDPEGLLQTSMSRRLGL